MSRFVGTVTKAASRAEGGDTPSSLVDDDPEATMPFIDPLLCCCWCCAIARRMNTAGGDIEHHDQDPTLEPLDGRVLRRHVQGAGDR